MALYTYGGTLLAVGANGLATSSNCCCGNEQWRKCLDDTNLAVLSAGHTAVDYAWLCVGSVWVKGYNYASTATVATDPTVLEQCDNGAPTSCASLVGWPASDDFGGTGCDTASIGGINNTMRWTQSGGTPTLVSGAQRWTTTGAIMYSQSRATKSGDFLISCDMTVVSGYSKFGFEITIGSIIYTWQYDAGRGSLLSYSPTYGFVFEESRTPSGTENFEISKSGSTVTFKIGGVTKFTRTETGTMNAIKLQVWDGSFSIDFDNFIFEDGASGEVRIDPSGLACT